MIAVSNCYRNGDIDTYRLDIPQTDIPCVVRLRMKNIIESIPTNHESAKKVVLQYKH